VTGSTSGFGNTQESYFKRVESMKLKAAQIVGFGIKDAETFQQATKNTKGAIIGSAFIKMLTAEGIKGIAPFIKSIR
ncbi:MAG: tryptophan synthase subunit alpha, partial [Cyanobacteria bacterium P01_A01_bin.83]